MMFLYVVLRQVLMLNSQVMKQSRVDEHLTFEAPFAWGLINLVLEISVVEVL
jgi:hypothetical protein